MTSIGDYAIIGDSRSAALVSREGSIDWLCWPRFDSRSCFGRLLDETRGGYFSIKPDIPFRVARRYVDGTNVLETTFITEKGSAVLLDLMPALAEDQKSATLLPFRELFRRLRGTGGDVPIRVEFVPRPDYGRTVPRLDVRGDCVACTKGPEVWHLRSNIALTSTGPGAAGSSFTIRDDESVDFALSYETHAPSVYPQIGSSADVMVENSIAFWQRWSSSLTYDGPYRDAVLRSALALKLLAYAPSGGIVAAPTTSLPEWPGGVRNWDYRYCWLRDASFTVAALYDCGFEIEGAAFVGWLLYSTRLTQPNLQILYDVFGESRLPERLLDHLSGFAGSRPVRVGNDAHAQFQLDVYGEVLGAIEEYTERSGELSRDAQRVARKLADVVTKRWREPDSGIWEKRSGRHQHVHAKIMAWAALDSAERLVKKGLLHADPARWSAAKDEIKREVLGRGFNSELNSFVGEYDGRELDASLLYVSRVGFLEGDDPRLLGTIDAIRRELGASDLIYRYRTAKTDDGLPAGEGAFLPCSFWLVEALAIAKRMDEARELFEQLLARANDVGLFSEEAGESGELLGNFPQALTHVGLLNAALRLEEPKAKRGKQTRSASASMSS
jgi:GH15 family glucan-1,4-alpha-glucosidase